MTRATRLRFRPARIEDHATFVRLFAELAVPDPPPDEARFRSVVAPHARFAEDETGAVVGYTYSEALESDGYIRNVVVDPAARGGGVGRALMEDLAQRFRDGGCTRWRLNVKPDNVAARALYEACGMTAAYSGHSLRLRWDDVARLPSPAGRAEDIPVAERSDFEAAFDLPRGLLESLGRRGFETFGVRGDGGAPIATCAFDPRFPGAFPFRARGIAAARALLEGARERRHRFEDAERPWRDVALQVTVEDDEPLAAALLGAGAESVLLTMHYIGRL